MGLDDKTEGSAFYRPSDRQYDESRPESRHRDGDEAFLERRIMADATADDGGMPPLVVTTDRRRDHRRQIDRMSTGI